MVPLDPERLAENVRANTVLLARGAESEIRLGGFLGAKAVYKLRVRKEYMDPRLDSRLRRTRTVREARVIAVLNRGGVPSPRLYMVLPSAGLIVMEYVEGPRLKEALGELVSPGEAGRLAGEILGRVHRLGIVHGDPTTSNYIVRGGGLVLIDYGLSEFSSDVEDRAVDVHLFKRSLEATHAGLSADVLEGFYEGYVGALGDAGQAVLERAREIELRGRYIEERRKSVWGL